MVLRYARKAMQIWRMTNFVCKKLVIVEFWAYIHYVLNCRKIRENCTCYYEKIYSWRDCGNEGKRCGSFKGKG